MYQSLQPSEGFECFSNNIRYLKWSNSNGAVGLNIIRDLCRWPILIFIFVDTISNTPANNELLWLLLPYTLPFTITFIYTFYCINQWYQLSTKTSTISKQICLWSLISIPISIIAILAFAIYVIMFPTTIYHIIALYGNLAQYIDNRLFKYITERQIYINTLLQYVINGNKNKEIKKRLAVISYVLTVKCVGQPHKLQRINFLANIHNANVSVGWSILKWTDIRYSLNVQIYAYMWSAMLLLVNIYDILIVIGIMCVYYQYINIWTIVIISLYVIVEGVFLLFDIKYLEIYFYCYHIRVLFNNWNRCGPWTVFEHVDDMMEMIHIMNQITIEPAEQIGIIQKTIKSVNDDIANIIGQYLTLQLPIYVDNKWREYQLQFDKIITDFEFNI